MKKRFFLALMIVSMFLLPVFMLNIKPVFSQVQRFANSDGSFENEWGEYEMTVYYPTKRRWFREIPDSSGAPYPAVVFAHGFLACKEWYSWLVESLAERGIIVLSFTVPDRMLLDVQQWVAGIEYGIEYLIQKTGMDGELHGMVDIDRIGVVGHSMGGMATILVAASNPNVKVAISLSAPYINDPFDNKILEQFRGSISWEEIYTAATEIEIPIQYQIGSLDKLAASNSHTYFDVTLSSKKEFVVIDGANHVQYLDDVKVWNTLSYAIPLLEIISSSGDGDSTNNFNLFTLFRLLSKTIIDVALSAGIDNPAQISVKELHQTVKENIFLWFETYL